MKTKTKYKARGSILVLAILTTVIWILIAQSFFILYSSNFNMIKSSRVALQAQQYAEITVDTLKNIAYENLDSEGAHARAAMTNIQENGWEDEVTIGEEHDIAGSDGAKQRIATVNIYKTNDTIPRFTLEVPLSSQNSFKDKRQENGYLKLPNGLILQWGNKVGCNNFPIAFPHTCLIFVCGNTNRQGDVVDNTYGYAINNYQYYLDTKRSDGKSNIATFPSSYIAIGY